MTIHVLKSLKEPDIKNQTNVIIIAIQPKHAIVNFRLHVAVFVDWLTQ